MKKITYRIILFLLCLVFTLVFIGMSIYYVITEDVVSSALYFLEASIYSVLTDYFARTTDDYEN